MRAWKRGRHLLRREELVAQMRHRLERHSFPRLQMMLIVSLAGLFGWLSSLGLLSAGLDNMAWRYPSALMLAYGCFLGLLWLWLRTSAQDYGSDLPNPLDLVPTPDIGPDAVPGPQVFSSGGGGDFAGGGAQASFADPGPVALTESSGSSSSLPDLKEVAGSVGDADELAIPLVVIVLLVGLALSSCYVIYVAPGLFAELMVDGALSVVLYRRMHMEDRSHWLSTAVRRTIWPLLITAAFVAGMGAMMHQIAPEARTLGDVIRHHQLDE